MTNIRVYDLSRELNVSNKRVMDVAKRIGIQVKSHASCVSEEEARRIRDSILSSSTNGRASLEQKEEAKEQIKVFTSETGEEVVERRKGKSVIIRKRKRVEEPLPQEHAEEEAKPSFVEAEHLEDELSEEPLAVGAEVVEETREVTAAESGTVEEPVAAEFSVEEAGEATEGTEELPPVISLHDETETEAAVGKGRAKTPEEKAEEALKKKKVKKAKPKREEIIDEETLEELRRAFKTKLPGRRREYLVDDRRPKPRLFSENVRSAEEALKKGRQIPHGTSKEAEPQRVDHIPGRQEKKVIKIGESINVGELAKRMSLKASDLIKKLFSLGVRVTINQSLDYETASIVASEFGFEVSPDFFEEKDLLETGEEGGEPVPRPPVVTVMGHVDHGKTTLLDSIRRSKLVDMEAGGITQHIGAYSVDVDSRKIVFVDTPGHEAFTAMRARGAKVTDIVILVVAADDGVMPQTIEAVNHAKAAGVPIVVAINKIDKPEANRDRVMRQLSEIGLVPEEWGGDTMVCDVSAKKNIGIKELLEMVLLQADILELKAKRDVRAKGTVIESFLDKGRGPVATVIVQEGTLRVGDYAVAGLAYGRVRALYDDKGERVNEAGPSMPVQVLGLSGVPDAGEYLYVVKDEKSAKEIIQHRENKEREKLAAKTRKISLDNLFETLKEGEVKELPLIVKGDTHGSVEALCEAILGIESSKCRVKIIHSGVGAITETDVALASASNAIVVGFNVRPDPKALALAEKENVSMELHNIIYNAIERVRSAMAGLLEPIKREKILGHADVKATFQVAKVGTIAGCYVSDGTVSRGSNVRVIRDGVTVYQGKIGSLKRFKEDVREVQSGYECGIGVENFNDIKVGDRLEVYTFEEFQPEL